MVNLTKNKKLNNKIKETLKNLKKLKKKNKEEEIKKKLTKTSKYLKNLRKKTIKNIQIVDKSPSQLKTSNKKNKIKTKKIKTSYIKVKGKKFYAADRYENYNIHKSTLLSWYPEESCQGIINILGKNNVSGIQTPPDKFLAARGIKWVRCLKDGKAEFHFVLPWHLAGEKGLKEITVAEQFENPYKTQFFESHVGLYVPDLTECAIRANKINYNHMIVQRQDGLYQLYVHLPGCLSWIEFDSISADVEKLEKNGIKIITFEQANEIGLKYQKEFFAKHKDDNSKKLDKILNNNKP